MHCRLGFRFPAPKHPSTLGSYSESTLQPSELKSQVQQVQQEQGMPASLWTEDLETSAPFLRPLRCVERRSQGEGRYHTEMLIDVLPGRHAVSCTLHFHALPAQHELVMRL